MDSILHDIRDAEEGILGNPVYYILNMCRVLYYVEEGVVSSKKEAGEWSMNRLPAFRSLVEKSLLLYEGKQQVEWDAAELKQFAKELQLHINRIAQTNTSILE